MNRGLLFQLNLFCDEGEDFGDVWDEDGGLG